MNLVGANRTIPPGMPMMFLCAVLVMITLTSAEGALFRAYRGEPLHWQALITGRAIAWGTCAAFVPPLYFLTTRWPLGRRSWRVALPLHLGASLVATVGRYLLYVPLARALDGAYDTDWLTALREGFLGELMFYWAMIGLAHAYFFYMGKPLAVGKGANEKQKFVPYTTPAVAERISVNVGASTEMLLPNDIEWLAAEGNYVRIYLADRQLLVRHTIRAFETRLPSNFVRVHRSVVVNARQVRRVEPAGNGRWRISMSAGSTTTSGRSYREAVRNRLK